MQICAPPTGQRDQKIISPTSFSREVFYSDTSPLSSPHPTGASAFVSSSSHPSRLKHSRSLVATSPKSLAPRSRGLSSVEERDEAEARRRSSASLAQMKFYKRTRSVKEPRELSSPKKTEETFPKAKEQHHTPQKSAIQAQKATAGKNGTTAQSASSVTPTQAGKQSSPGRPDPQSRIIVVPGEVHGKTNGRGGNLGARRHPQERGLEATAERTKAGSDQNTPRKRTERASLHQRAPPSAVKEAETGASKSSRQRESQQRAAEIRSSASQEQSDDRGRDGRKQRSAAVLPREAQGRREAPPRSKDDGGGGKEIVNVSVNSIPEAVQSPKGTLSPGPWKTPSSAKILSHAEVLQDPS